MENMSMAAAVPVEKASGLGLVGAFFAAMMAAFWSYEGWNTVGYIGGEIQNPNKNLPLALFLGLLTIIVTYTLVNFTYLYVLPIDKIIAIHNAKNDFAAVAGKITDRRIELSEAETHGRSGNVDRFCRADNVGLTSV